MKIEDAIVYCLDISQSLERGGADVVIEVAGGKDTFRLAWKCARPNAIVTVVALYDEPQALPPRPDRRSLQGL